MKKICINPLSANRQIFTSDELVDVVRKVVECFKYLRPAIDLGVINLIYDPVIEGRQLIDGHHLNASINSIPRDADGQDIKKIWFIFAKNKASEASLTQSYIELKPKNVNAGYLFGDVSADLIDRKLIWLSFGMSASTEAAKYAVVSPGVAGFEVDNAFSLESMVKLLPQYLASDKHRKVGYHDTRGNFVSPMTLDDEGARVLLLCSMSYRDDRWAYLKSRAQYFRFKITRENVYHGFDVVDADVPDEVKGMLNNR
jgi:hypothetical protein